MGDRPQVASSFSTRSRTSCLQCSRQVARRLWMHGMWLRACFVLRKSGAPESATSSSGGCAELADIILSLARLTDAKPPKRHTQLRLLSRWRLRRKPGLESQQPPVPCRWRRFV